MVGISIEQMGQATEDYEGDELKEEQFERDVGTANEVKEFNGYGEICDGNEKVADFLANEDAVYAPNTFLVITVAVVIFSIGGRSSTEDNNKVKKKQQQQ